MTKLVETKPETKPEPTLEHILEELRRIPVRCQIQKLKDYPSDDFIRGWAVGLEMASKTAKEELSKVSQLILDLTPTSNKTPEQKDKINEALRVLSTAVRDIPSNLYRGWDEGEEALATIKSALGIEN